MDQTNYIAISTNATIAEKNFLSTIYATTYVRWFAGEKILLNLCTMEQALLLIFIFRPNLKIKLNKHAISEKQVKDKEVTIEGSELEFAEKDVVREGNEVYIRYLRLELW